MDAVGMIRVRGAREHNLQDVDVDIPRDAFVAITGVSGSGKSSLAFGTIYAEAQRRYLESVAPYARRLLHQVAAPHVRELHGLPPAIALQQRRSAASSRSTVGTITGISNSLRMLMSRAGTYPDGAERLDSDAFSPNTAAGACRNCQGLGRVYTVTEASLVPDPTLTIRDKAIAAWPGAWQGKNYRDILDTMGYNIDIPWSKLAQADRDWILFTDEQPVVTVHPVREAHRTHRPYQGMYMSPRRYVLKTLSESQSAAQRARAERYVDTMPCESCGGARLRREALAVTWQGHTIAQLAGLELTDLAATLRPIADDTAHEDTAEGVLCRDMVHMIDVLLRMGLGYLATDRITTTLSTGEHQRLRIATQLRSGLFGVVYVLDEPSAGLHPADAEPLIDTLQQLRDAGNTVMVVEHDMTVVKTADWMVDVGPGAGSHGGRILHSGPVADLVHVEESVTRRYVDRASSAPQLRTPRTTRTMIDVHGITHHNLRNLDVAMPAGVLTAITGISGSGKSSLLSVLALRAADHELDGIDRVVSVDQSPIGRTPRSNLATYTGLFDAVRKVFAATDQAKERGYRAGHFSFNVAGGRCETCQGDGYVAVELMFLPGTYGPCPDCAGARYTAETLAVTWNAMSIADVLHLTVDEAVDAFADVPAAMRPLRALQDIGLGYLHLGQPATDLSGGEAQRIKLASELQRSSRGHVLYLLDEPTSGLHPADAELLMAQLNRLVDAGHTVVIAEHTMHVVASCDYVIDLGPGAGDAGGCVVCAGSPAEVSSAASSRTAPYLAAARGADA